MERQYDAVIIGGGASGLMASVQAKRRGKHIAIIEKSAQIGRKILVTGNGRCNLSNQNVTQDYRIPKHYFGENPKFILGVLNKFGLEETLDFFHRLGIDTHEEDNGRLFPISNQAQSVVDVLLSEIRDLGIKIYKPASIKELKYNKNAKQYAIELNDGKRLISKKLVIAAGGKTHKELGATDDGYKLAEKFGHSIISTMPAYSALNIKTPLCYKLQGVKLEVKVKALSKGKIVAQNEGTLMFTHFGLSAPAVLEISRIIAGEMKSGKKVELEINFLPFLKDDQVKDFVLERWGNAPAKSLNSSFTGILPKKVFPAILEVNAIDGDKKVSDISKEVRNIIIGLLTGYKFEVESVRGFDEAHFTAGGVNTKEIDPQTLESKIQPGLYFCGEVLDIDGECGGYNLQWAWSSGAVAGENI